MKWLVPITIVEYGRAAIVEAPTRKAAIALMREQKWEELMDADRYKVTKDPKRKTEKL